MYSRMGVCPAAGASIRVGKGEEHTALEEGKRILGRPSQRHDGNPSRTVQSSTVPFHHKNRTEQHRVGEIYSGGRASKTNSRSSRNGTNWAFRQKGGNKTHARAVVALPPNIVVSYCTVLEICWLLSISPPSAPRLG